MTHTDFDIAVFGGGMVGASVALAAARTGLRVALLERERPPAEWAQESFDLRVSALTRASQVILQNLGVWQHMQRLRVSPYERMRVWDRRGIGEIAFDAADIGEPDLGHIVENRVIVAALWQALEAESGVTSFFGRDLQAVDADSPLARLVFGDGSELSAQLLVGADGARSRVRELAGIGLRGHDYDQKAVVATVRAEQGTRATAWQRFMPTGPLALLPLTRECFSIVWSTDPEEAGDLLALSPAQFNTRLTQASEHCCGDLALQGERAAFPLRLQHANAYVQAGLALVGDAAHVIHPLAGQGVNLGLLDAGVLVDVLAAARDRHEPLGGMRVLRRYERARKGHNVAVQLAMDGFKHLFSNRNPGLFVVRNLGLGLANRIAPLRHQFERVALGRGIELPSLARTRPEA